MFRVDTAEKIIKQIRRYDTVSFDIFDTLLKRDVVNPHEVFRLLGSKHDEPDFAQHRIEAETRLREKNNKEEITLHEIYQFMDSRYSSYESEEINYERCLLRINPIIYPVYDYCKKNNKKIVITSDMYLPQEILEAVLKSNGYSWDYFYLSSSCNLQKGTGNLFKKILDELHLHPNEIIHIGDSISSDFLGARKVGIKCILIQRAIYRTNLTVSKNNLSAFIQNTINVSEDIYQQIGYACLGPLLYGYITWLHDELTRKKIQKVFFFSRDGFLMKNAWEEIYGENKNIKYLYVSRRSVSVPQLKEHCNWEEFDQYITMTRFFSIRTLLKRLGLEDKDYTEALSKYGLRPDQILYQGSFKSTQGLFEFFKSVKDEIEENATSEYNAMCSYLQANEFYGNVAVVDIGWNGSMQRNLALAAASAGIDVSMEGFYFGVKKHTDKLKMNGWLYDTKQTMHEATLSFMHGLFEEFFLSKDGSTRKYIIEGDIAKPVLYLPEYEEHSPEVIAFDKCQKAALKFCGRFHKSFIAEIEKRSKEEYSENLLRLGIRPNQEEAETFGNFRFFDTDVVNIAKPKTLGYYMIHPKEMMIDFSDSVWKTAFMYRLFKLPLPYQTICYWLRKTILKIKQMGAYKC